MPKFVSLCIPFCIPLCPAISYSRYPQTSWGDIIGMRNRLVHTHFEIDIDVIWQVVSAVLPNLLPEIEKMVQDIK